MRVKLACRCLFGTFLLFVSTGSANIQRTVYVPLRPSLAGKSFANIAPLPALEKSVDKIASLPSAAASFFHELGAPEIRETETPDTIDAPKESPPTPLARARAAL